MGSASSRLRQAAYTAAHGQAHVALRGIAPGHGLHLGAEQLAVQLLGGGQHGSAGPGERGPLAPARSLHALGEVGEHLLGGAPLIVGIPRNPTRWTPWNLEWCGVFAS